MAMTNTLGRNFHFILSVLAAAVLGYMVWFWHPTHPQPATPEAAAWHIFIVSVTAMIYLAIQAAATLAQPVGSERHILTDLLFSLLPILVFGYALIDWARDNLEMTIFQWMTLGVVTLSSFTAETQLLAYVRHSCFQCLSRSDEHENRPTFV